MDCPRCGSRMRDAQVHGCALKTCGECEGTWYPGEALGTVTDHSLSELRQGPLKETLVADKLEAIDLEAPISCPRCARPMMRYRYTMSCDVILDECLEHGVWLDDGELGSLMKFLEDMVGVDEETEERLSLGVMEKNLEYLEELSRSSEGASPLSGGVLEALYRVHSRPR